MKPLKFAAITLIIAGIVGLAYGSFTYTKAINAESSGTAQLTVREKQALEIPLWASVGAIVVGGAILIFGSKKP
jgi:hypothetical protein